MLIPVSIYGLQFYVSIWALLRLVLEEPPKELQMTIPTGQVALPEPQAALHTQEMALPKQPA